LAVLYYSNPRQKTDRSHQKFTGVPKAHVVATFSRIFKRFYYKRLKRFCRFDMGEPTTSRV